MLMKWLLFIVLLAMLSCSEKIGSEKGTDIYFRSYVMYYWDIKDLELKDNPEKGLISCSMVIGDYVGGYADTDMSHKTTYDALCEKHNDMKYDRVVRRFSLDPNIDYLCADIVSIEIKSDSPYNASHLAGSSLADIVILDSYSAQPYIDNEYVMYDWGEQESLLVHHDKSGKKPYYPVYKKVSDLTSLDLMLLGAGSCQYYKYWHYRLGVFRFQSSPTLSKTHKFTVTMTADDGRIFTASIDMTFE